MGLKYPKDSAARIMQREFVTIDLDWTVGQTMDFLRDSTDLPEQFLEIFVVDKEEVKLQEQYDDLETNERSLQTNLDENVLKV